MPEDFTRVISPEPEGSWSNPQVAQTNRQLAVLPNADSYRAPMNKPTLYFTRIVVALVLVPLLLGLVLSTSLASWAQNSLVEDDGFSLITTDMVNDAELQQKLEDAVVSDIMSNSAVQNAVGDGNSGGILGGVQNWAHDQLQNTITSTVDSVFTSADYPQIWQQVMDASHTYNMNNPDVAGIDIAPIFNAVDAKIGTILGFDPDFTKTTFIVPIESTQNKVLSDNISILKNYGATWQAQLAAAIVLAVVIFLIAPTRRLWWTAWTAALAAVLLWVVSTLVGRFTLPSFGSETARIFANGLTEAFTISLRDHLWQVAFWMLGVAALAFLLAVVVMVIKLGTRNASAATRRILRALG